jgi:hypothetical protein
MSVFTEGFIIKCMLSTELSSHLISSYQLPVTVPVYNNVLRIKKYLASTNTYLQCDSEAYLPIASVHYNLTTCH